MAAISVIDLTLHRNVTKAITFNLKDGLGDPFDLTDYTVAADAVGSILPSGRLELTPTFEEPRSLGQITIELDKTTTGTLITTEGVAPTLIPKWDMLIDLDGVTTKVIEGHVYIRETLTT